MLKDKRLIVYQKQEPTWNWATKEQAARRHLINYLPQADWSLWLIFKLSLRYHIILEISISDQIFFRINDLHP